MTTRNSLDRVEHLFGSAAATARVAELIEEKIRLDETLRSISVTDPDGGDLMVSPMGNYAQSPLDDSRSEVDGIAEQIETDSARGLGLMRLANALNMYRIRPKNAGIIPSLFEDGGFDALPQRIRGLIDRAWRTMGGTGTSPRKPWKPKKARSSVQTENPYAHPDASWLAVGLPGGEPEFVIRALYSEAKEAWLVVKCQVWRMAAKSFNEAKLPDDQGLLTDLRTVQWEGTPFTPSSNLGGTVTWLVPEAMLAEGWVGFQGGEDAARVAVRWQQELNDRLQWDNNGWGTSPEIPSGMPADYMSGV